MVLAVVPLATQSFYNAHQGAITLISLIVAIVFGLGGIALAYYYYRRQQRTKTLDYAIQSNSLIAESGGFASRFLEVTWQKTPINKPRLIVMRMRNTGSEGISTQDFDGPITLTVSDAGIIVAECIGTSPSLRHKPDLEYVGNTCNISPVLLNPKDWIDIQLLVDDEPLYDPSDGTFPALRPPSSEPRIDVGYVIAGQTRPGREAIPYPREGYAEVPWSRLVFALLIGSVVFLAAVSAIVTLATSTK